jgi:hypothetical protein
MLWGIYSVIYGEVNVSVEKCVEIKGGYVEKQQSCFISVTLKSWSGRKLLDPTTYETRRTCWHQIQYCQCKSSIHQHQNSSLDLNLRINQWNAILGACLALYRAENRTHRGTEQKYLESFGMWCWRRMEKFSRKDRVKSEEVLLGRKEKRNSLHTIKRKKANWIGHILRRNRLLKHVFEERHQMYCWDNTRCAIRRRWTKTVGTGMRIHSWITWNAPCCLYYVVVHTHTHTQK